MAAKELKKYLITLVILLILDIIWIFGIMGEFYSRQLSGFARPVVVPIWSAALVWLLIPLGIVLFVDRVARSNRQSLAYGAVYGLILYGVYDLTNYATLGNWTIQLVIVDVLWGTFLCSVSSLGLRVAGKKWLR